ncbi:TRET1 [Sergentomyia squamirostris]
MHNGNNDRRTDLPSADVASPEDISQLQIALPQILAVSVKNILLFGYGMTLGFPTILIPAIQGGEGREPTQDDQLILSKDEISWLSSINLICVPLGCIFSGSITHPIGRRRAMQLVNLPILIAWLIFYFSTQVVHLYVGLCLAGITGGLLEAPVLTYVAEITQPRVRGMLAASGSFFTILGVFAQFLMGTFLKWRLIALISCALPVISVILLFFIPESPHWLLQKHRLPEARKSLAWLRGWVSETNALVSEEFREICEKAKERSMERIQGKSCVNNYHEYLKKTFVLPFLLISYTFFIGHFSGMTTLQTYAVQIFHTLKAPIDKYYATMLLGIAELMGTLFCVALVHFTGKRPIVFISTIGCGMCFLATGTYTHLLHLIPGTTIHNIVANVSAIESESVEDLIAMNISLSMIDEEENTVMNITDMELFAISPIDEINGNYTVDNLQTMSRFVLNESDYYDVMNDTVMMEEDEVVEEGFPKNIIIPLPEVKHNKYLWIPLTLLLGSAFLSHMGIRLIPWMLVGEIYPANVRSCASGISGGIGYIFGFLANKLFLDMVSKLTLPGTFWLYSVVSLTGALVLYFFLPETEGRTLNELEEHFLNIGKKSQSPPISVESPPSPGHSDHRHDHHFHLDIKKWESNKIFQQHLQKHHVDHIHHIHPPILRGRAHVQHKPPVTEVYDTRL